MGITEAINSLLTVIGVIGAIAITAWSVYVTIGLVFFITKIAVEGYSWVF